MNWDKPYYDSLRRNGTKCEIIIYTPWDQPMLTMAFLDESDLPWAAIVKAARSIVNALNANRMKARKKLEALLTYLDNNHVVVDELHGFVALTKDKKTIFFCQVEADGSPERWEPNPRYLDWNEVTAPDAEFVDTVNEIFGTSFELSKFAGR